MHATGATSYSGACPPDRGFNVHGRWTFTTCGSSLSRVLPPYAFTIPNTRATEQRVRFLVLCEPSSCCAVVFWSAVPSLCRSMARFDEEDISRLDEW